MAKLTGQFTTPSLDAQNNKIHKPFLHGVVFVFTGTTKVTRETDAKGKYSFDLANGEYEVSVYLKGNTEKDRFDMRAGEKFTVTTTIQADALEKWLQVIGISGKDELATYYENLLAQMQKVANDFKDTTQSVGTGNFVKETGAAKACLRDAGRYYTSNNTSNIDTWASGESGLLAGVLSNIPTDVRSLFSDSFMHVETKGIYRSNLSNRWQIVRGYRKPEIVIRQYTPGDAGKWTSAKLYSTYNTTVDSNGFIKAASPIIKLFNDRIEHSGFGANKPVFEKLGVGQYKISNTLGLAQEGWTYEKPRGSDGQPYFRIIVEKLEDGCIVRVHDEYDTIEKAEITDIDGNTRTVDKIVKILGQARDIKDHERWIDLRFHEESEEHQEVEEEFKAEE